MNGQKRPEHHMGRNVNGKRIVSSTNGIVASSDPRSVELRQRAATWASLLGFVLWPLLLCLSHLFTSETDETADETADEMDESGPSETAQSRVEPNSSPTTDRCLVPKKEQKKLFHGFTVGPLLAEILAKSK